MSADLCAFDLVLSDSTYKVLPPPSIIQMANIVPHVKYRIKSVDFLTCLELLDPAMSRADVSLRPARDTDSQYWLFEEVPGFTGYFVRNAVNSNQRLWFNKDKGFVYAANETSTPYSLVNVLYRDGVYRLFFHIENSNNYFHTSDEDTKVRITTSNNDLDSQKWQLVPVTSQPIHKDVLQPGIYRIRNLDGKSLLTMPGAQSTGSTNVYIRHQLDQSPDQRWTVARQDSGQYTIQSTGNSSYLGATAAVVGSGLVGSPTMYLWDIPSVGGYAWSLRIPATKLSVGVADNEIEDGNEASIVHSNSTSSQIWFMEKYIPLGQEKIHAKREVPEGKYFLLSANHESTYMRVDSTPWRIIPGTIADCPFELKYINDNSAHFTLTYVSKTPTTPTLIIVDGGGYVALDLKGTEFVLLEKDQGDPGYVICRPDSGRPYKVISGRVKSDFNNRPVFSIDNKVAGSTMQMWLLVPAP